MPVNYFEYNLREITSDANYILEKGIIDDSLLYTIKDMKDCYRASLCV